MEFTSRQLRAFLLAAHYKSFSRAAEALHITPSGLSLIIKELELQLEFRLFDRTTRSVVLTHHGQTLLATSQRILSDWDSATMQIGSSASRANQLLRFGTLPLLAANIVTKAIKEYRAQKPMLRIQLTDDRSPAILRLVQAGELDVGLGVFPPTVGIRRTTFLRSPLLVIRGERSAALHRKTITWSALQGETFVMIEPWSPMQQEVNDHLRRAGVVPHLSHTVNLIDTQIAMVEADEGIAIIPSYGLSASRARKIVASRLIHPVVEVELSQISNRGKQLTEEASGFMAFLRSSFSELRKN